MSLFRSDLKRGVVFLLALGVCAFLLWRTVFAKDANYFDIDEFEIGLTASHEPTADTMGMTLEFLRIDGGAEACAGIEVIDRGLQVELRLVRADAPKAQADYPLLVMEDELSISFEHKRTAKKGQGVRYAFYGGGDRISQVATVTPTVN